MAREEQLGHNTTKWFFGYKNQIQPPTYCSSLTSFTVYSIFKQLWILEI